jgi:hypothetical protein
MMRSMSFHETTFRAVVRDLLAVAPPEAGMWIEAAIARGPNPPGGPLLHDLLLPGASVGLNLFGFDRALTAVAIGWAHALLGDDGGSAAEALLSSGAAFSGGFATHPLRLKLYASGPRAAALAPPTRWPVHAVGIDIGRQGAGRIRTYHLPAPGLLDGFDVPADFDAWPGRKLITVLRGEGRERRTLNYLFAPGDPLDGLLAFPLDPVPLQAADTRLREAGMVLRPVAWEVDLWSDGERGTDVLVAVGQPQNHSASRPRSNEQNPPRV